MFFPRVFANSEMRQGPPEWHLFGHIEHPEHHGLPPLPPTSSTCRSSLVARRSSDVALLTFSVMGFRIPQAGGVQLRKGVMACTDMLRKLTFRDGVAHGGTRI